MDLLEVINGILYALRAGGGSGAISLSSGAGRMPSSCTPPAPKGWIPQKGYPRTGKAADSLTGDGGRSGEFSFVPSHRAKRFCTNSPALTLPHRGRKSEEVGIYLSAPFIARRLRNRAGST